MNKHFKIGITGGIGSGKSTVSKVLLALEYPVYNSDERAKALMNEDPALVSGIQDLFGTEVYSNKKLDRKKLAEIVFQNASLLKALNALVHPAVRADFKSWVQEQATEIVFQESALLFETGGYQLLDFTVLVTAPESMRIQRVLKRDTATEVDVKARMSNQLSEVEKIEKANYVIVNDNAQLLIVQIEQMLQEVSLLRQSTSS